MTAFIKYNLKKLFGVRHFFVLVVYDSFAWFLSNPVNNRDIVYNSRLLTVNYEIILMSLVFLNFMFFIVSNFKQELAYGRKDLLLTRITSEKLIMAFIITYSIYWIVGFALPSYLTALAQQYYYASEFVEIDVFALKYLCSVFGYPVLLIAGAIYMFVHVKNRLVFITTATLLYMGFHLAGFATGSRVFNYFWLYDIVKPGNSFSRVFMIVASLAVSMMISLSLIRLIAKKMPGILFPEKKNVLPGRITWQRLLSHGLVKRP